MHEIDLRGLRGLAGSVSPLREEMAGFSAIPHGTTETNPARPRKPRRRRVPASCPRGRRERAHDGVPGVARDRVRRPSRACGAGPRARPTHRLGIGHSGLSGAWPRCSGGGQARRSAHATLATALPSSHPRAVIGSWGEPSWRAGGSDGVNQAIVYIYQALRDRLSVGIYRGTESLLPLRVFAPLNLGLRCVLLLKKGDRHDH